jgi:hypothetical protein
MLETDIMRLIQLKAGELGYKTWRNNVGAYKDSRGFWIRYGVAGKGGSDLIGLQVGTGRFVAIEVKSPTGVISDEQEAFLNAVRNDGGIAGVCRSVEDFLALIK